MNKATMSDGDKNKIYALRSLADSVDEEIKNSVSLRLAHFGFIRARDWEYVKACLTKEAVILMSIIGLNLVQTFLSAVKAITLLAFAQTLFNDPGADAKSVTVLGISIPLPFEDLASTENGRVITIFLILVAVVAVSQLVTYFVVSLNTLLQNRLTYRIRRDFIDKLLNLDISYFSETKLGELEFLLNQPVAKFSQIVSATQTVLMSTLNIMVFVAILLKLSVGLTALVAVTGILFYLASSNLSRRVVFLSRDLAQKGRLMMASFFDMLHGIRLIKQGAKEGEVKQVYLDRVSTVLRATLSMNSYQQLVRGITEAGGIFSLIFAVTLFSYLADANLIENLGFTVGYFFVALQVLMRVRELIEARMRQAQAIPQITFLTRFLDLEEHSLGIAKLKGTHPFEHVEQEIKIDNVSFGYVPGRPVLRNFSCAFRRGTITALVGLSGSGKSSLMELIATFRLPDTGQITVDGRPLSELDIGSYRKRLGYVSQDSVVFNESIRENITYFRDQVGQEEIDQALDTACIKGFLDTLEDGLDTIVGERGTSLSGGQRQRVVLARALIQNPEILLLDEATSAMDLQTEATIYDNLEKIKDDKVIVISAHRLSAITNVDHIIVVSDGRILEQGTHSDLMAVNGLYKSLFKIQEYESTDAGIDA
mgnify:CR=1 FL=1|jgi:subfamily B ATP-binding cassette protein MsbA